jgi:pimeloyl-ACP methyl ester carboxylesterase
VHGFGANGRLWDGVVGALGGGFHCVLPDLPLGSHPEAMDPSADQSPHGIARLLYRFIEALGLEDVTLVGNDSGGAVCQLMLTAGETPRVGALVLTNCDAFEKFPPGHFRTMQKLIRLPGARAAFGLGLRLRPVRRSRLTYGALTAKPIDDELLLEFTRPMTENPGVARDGLRFFAQADVADTLAAARKLPELNIPSLLVWGDADTFFTIGDARRLAGLLPDSELVPVPGGKTFLPLDDPDRIASEIAAFTARRLQPVS